MWCLKLTITNSFADADGSRKLERSFGLLQTYSPCLPKYVCFIWNITFLLDAASLINILAFWTPQKPISRLLVVQDLYFEPNLDALSFMKLMATN